YQRQPQRISLEEQQLISVPTDEPDRSEQEYECLKWCLQQLSVEYRELIMSYYLKDNQTKIDHRKELARRLGINTNALRVRMHRIRSTLEHCIENCLNR
ncbi:MAG: RNA polymerase sigma factor, partial [Pyrinomonadaceae bacterium]